MRPYLMEMLVCPSCHCELAWEIAERDAVGIQSAEVRCPACEAEYQVRDGIGMFLTPDLVRKDLWVEVESRISQYAREHPDFERALLEVPLEDLGPADQFLRSQLLEERGEHAAAEHAAQAAHRGLYTSEYLSCSEEQIKNAIDWLKQSQGPIVDLASGLGSLVEVMAQELDLPVVASDFSPSVLVRDRERLAYLGLRDRVDLLAFDARRTPFREGAIKTLTTYQGLQNIEDPAGLLRELRRIVSGSFLALCVFLPEDDVDNKAVVEELGLSESFYRRPATSRFEEAGWEVDVLHECRGWAEPTPPCGLIDGMRIDSLPVVGTNMEWCTFLAT